MITFNDEVDEVFSVCITDKQFGSFKLLSVFSKVGGPRLITYSPDRPILCTPIQVLLSFLGGRKRRKSLPKVGITRGFVT